MQIGTKLGLASVGFFAGIFVCVRSDLGVFLCMFFAVLFGILAAARGRKAWLVVPAATLTVFAIFAWAAMNAS